MRFIARNYAPCRASNKYGVVTLVLSLYAGDANLVKEHVVRLATGTLAKDYFITAT
jgi:hypothetical protein